MKLKDLLLQYISKIYTFSFTWIEYFKNFFLNDKNIVNINLKSILMIMIVVIT